MDGLVVWYVGMVYKFLNLLMLNYRNGWNFGFLDDSGNLWKMISVV